jgi:predicted nuclease with TOPRIM domain
VITINNSNTPPKWVVFLMLVILGVLIVALYKGCQNYNRNESKGIDVKGRIERLVKDSVDVHNEIKDLKTQLQVIDGELGASNNKNAAYLDSFRVLNDHINSLKKRYKPITPNKDTSVTVVPNEYVVDCADCFMTIEKVQQLGVQYKADLDHVNALNKSKVDLLSGKVSILEKQNVSLNKNYRSLLDSVTSKKSELKRTLFFSLSALSINQIFPNAIGAGFLYEDKRRRVYGAKYYVSEHGPIYQADFSLPLSLKFK